MKIAYVTTYYSDSVEAWSGLGRTIRDSLASAGAEIIPIDNLKKSGFATHAFKKVLNKLQGKRYMRERDPHLLRYYAAQVSEKLRTIDCDVVFSPGTIPIAYLETSKPIAFYTDATFGAMVDYYPEYSELSAETMRDGNAMEAAALSRSSLAVYASEWAAKSAIEDYGFPKENTAVVPFGATVSSGYTEADVRELSAQRDPDHCRLLFVGVDWQRKGGDLAVEVAAELNRRGLKTSLDVAGCDPPDNAPDFVVRHGYLSRKDPAQNKKLNELFKKAHFFVMPTRAECFGVVFSEASSFGLPSLATKTGGISSAIHHGVNGWKLPLEDGAIGYADIIMKQMSSPEEYLTKALASYQEFDQKRRWEYVGKTIVSLIEERCL